MPHFNKCLFVALVLLIFLPLTSWVFGYQYLLPGHNSVYFRPSRYKICLATIRKQQIKIQSKYARVYKISTKRKQVYREATQLLIKNLTQGIFPYWYGTKWGYNGTTQVPGKGRIACGYFVTTVLRDAGFILERSSLAQLPSESMLKKICGNNITRFYHGCSKKCRENKTNSWVQSYKKKNGVYLIGLDTHTGFMIVEKNKVDFVHASGRIPFCVVRECATKSRTLIESKIKIVAQLSNNPFVIKKWITKSDFK